MRAVLLMVSLFGVVVLAVVVWQLLTLEWTPQGINQRPRDGRYWRSEQAPREGRQSGSILGLMRNCRANFSRVSAFTEARIQFG